MLQAVEGRIDQDGKVIVLEKVNLSGSRRVIVTILNEEPADETVNLALLSESVLAKDWERPEEDEAWSHLANVNSLQET